MYASVDVTHGSCIALVGRSGSGKSTPARLMAGLYELTAGRNLFDGNDLKILDRRSVRSQQETSPGSALGVDGFERGRLATATWDNGIRRPTREAGAGGRSPRIVHCATQGTTVFAMANDLRKSGIGTVGDIPCGTHFCHFYVNKKDLLDVLIPYFKTGLEQNEFCVWGIFDPLNEQEARSALERALPGADGHLAAGDIEIVAQSQWCRRDGVHDIEQLVRDWELKLEKALARGCAGMRVNVNAAWLVERDGRNLDAYEDQFSGLIANRRIILLCAYPLAVNHAVEILDAGYSHRFAIARRQGNWQVVETPELSEARAGVKRLNAELERRASQRTEELATADLDRRQEAAALHRAEEALRASGERSLCYFELGLVGMAIVSPAKGCIEVNRRLCDILGYERRELVQMTWAALTHPDDLAGDIRNYHRILAGEIEGYLLPKRWIRKNGDIVYTNVSVKCQRHGDGTINYFAVMVEELTGIDRPLAGEPAAAGQTDLKGHDGLPDHKDLSVREREVLRLIGSGRTVKEIAAALMLNQNTVSTYRSRVLTKLQLKSTAELIHYALKNHLAD